MSKPFTLSNKISTGLVTKYEFKPTGDINSQGLHFIPADMISSILEHTHTSDSERYYKLILSKDENGMITSINWEPLEPVSASTPDIATHSVETSSEIQIIFGIKRSKEYNKNNWPKEELPQVDYNQLYDLFRFKLGDETIYTHSSFNEILSAQDKRIFLSPKSSNAPHTASNYIVKPEEFDNFFENNR